MKTVIIDLSKPALKYELHKNIRETLGFPDYYGCNLDALHDCLTDIFEPTTVILRGARNAGTYMQGYVNVAVEVFTQSARENSHLRVVEE